MRFRFLLLAMLIGLPAHAQVSVDQHALDQLAPKQAAPAPSPAKPSAPQSSTQSRPQAAKPVVTPTQKPAAASAAPSVATAPPANVKLPPPLVVPTRPNTAAVPPTVAADAPTTVERRKDGLRVVFGTGRSDLNPATEAEIERLVQGDQSAAPTPEAASYTITSFAPGSPEDSSASRRLSLARALSLRSALIAKGVASVRIYVRALGPASPGFADGPADRADIVVAGNPVPPPAPAATPNQTAKPATPR